MKKFKNLLIAGFVSVTATFASAAESSIPDVGIDVSTYITDAGTKLAAVLGAAIAMGMAFWIVRKGIYAIKGNI